MSNVQLIFLPIGILICNWHFLKKNLWFNSVYIKIFKGDIC